MRPRPGPAPGRPALNPGLPSRSSGPCPRDPAAPTSHPSPELHPAPETPPPLRPLSGVERKRPAGHRCRPSAGPPAQLRSPPRKLQPCLPSAARPRPPRFSTSSHLSCVSASPHLRACHGPGPPLQPTLKPSASPASSSRWKPFPSRDSSPPGLTFSLGPSALPHLSDLTAALHPALRRETPLPPHSLAGLLRPCLREGEATVACRRVGDARMGTFTFLWATPFFGPTPLPLGKLRPKEGKWSWPPVTACSGPCH